MSLWYIKWDSSTMNNIISSNPAFIQPLYMLRSNHIANIKLYDNIDLEYNIIIPSIFLKANLFTINPDEILWSEQNIAWIKFWNSWKISYKVEPLHNMLHKEECGLNAFSLIINNFDANWRDLYKFDLYNSLIIIDLISKYKIIQKL